MYRSFNCKKCHRSSDQAINKYMLAWKADYFVCEQCDINQGFYVTLVGSHGPGKSYMSKHPKKSM